MDILIKSLEGSSSRDETKEIPREVHGILAVHVKIVKLLDTKVDISMAKLLQLKVTVCGWVKVFTFQQCFSDSSVAVSDSVKHFRIELPEEYGHHGNDVTLDLILSFPLLPGSSSTIGKAILSIHHIIQVSPVSAKCELKDLDSGGLVGFLFADWAFSYGNFGYGESFQLAHALHKPTNYLHFSMFPRLTPPPSRTDHNGLTQNPRPTRHPTFIPFTQTTALCVQESKEALADTPRHTPELLISQMSRLRLLHQQLKGKSDRRQRLQFLEDKVLSSSGGSNVATQISAGVTARRTH